MKLHKLLLLSLSSAALLACNSGGHVMAKSNTVSSVYGTRYLDDFNHPEMGNNNSGLNSRCTSYHQHTIANIIHSAKIPGALSSLYGTRYLDDFNHPVMDNNRGLNSGCTSSHQYNSANPTSLDF